MGKEKHKAAVQKAAAHTKTTKASTKQPAKIDIFISAILVADRDVKALQLKIKKVTDTLRTHYTNYELVVIDNGVPAKQLTEARTLLQELACIRIIQLSKRVDTDTAIYAGIETVIGDYICLMYNNDPAELLPKFVEVARTGNDVVFGVATNLKRKNAIHETGAKMFYWYNRRYLDIDIPHKSTYFITLNRSVANALTRSGRYLRHIRHHARSVGFTTTNFQYQLPEDSSTYKDTNPSRLMTMATRLVSNYSSHPLRAVTYFGMIAGLINIVYALYVVIVNLASNDVEAGWTSLSLQSSFMFLVIFIILAVISEYIGRVLEQTSKEAPYHIMHEFSSTVSVADETRRNITA